MLSLTDYKIPYISYDKHEHFENESSIVVIIVFKAEKDISYEEI